MWLNFEFHYQFEKKMLLHNPPSVRQSFSQINIPLGMAWQDKPPRWSIHGRRICKRRIAIGEPMDLAQKLDLFICYSGQTKSCAMNSGLRSFRWLRNSNKKWNDPFTVIKDIYVRTYTGYIRKDIYRIYTDWYIQDIKDIYIYRIYTVLKDIYRIYTVLKDIYRIYTVLKDIYRIYRI